MSAITPSVDFGPTAANVGIASIDFAWLELTRSCNLECRHCYAESSPRVQLEGAMTASDWKACLQDLRGVGCTAVQFISGEVFMVPY